MKQISLLIKGDSGAITIMTVIFMLAFLGLLAVVIDLGHLHTVQGELRNAADACALRGARAFLPDDLPTTPGLINTTIDPDPVNAKQQASNTIQLNKSDNSSFQVGDLPIDDIQVGIWDYVNRTLLAWQWPPDSSYWGQYIGPGISLPAKRAASMSQGPVSMTLANIFGISQVPVNAAATAALSGVGGFVPGSPALPFGPMGQYLPESPGPFHGTFRNDNSDTFGWSNLNPADLTPNANELKTIMEQGALYDCPMGSEVGLQNGVASSVIKQMTNQNNRFGLEPAPSLGSNIYTPSTTLINPATDPPVTYAETVYMMPVFDKIGDPDKFNHSAIVGAIPVKILQVADSPDNYIDVQILEGPYVAPGYGGGPYYGILATEPKLVQ